MDRSIAAGNSPTTTFCAISLLRRSHTSRITAKYGATNPAVSSWCALLWNPAMIASLIAFGSSSSSVAFRHASALASGVGRSARAVAARRWPDAVGSRSSSASISASPAAPSATSPCSSVQRSSASTASPGTTTSPDSSPRSCATCSADRADPANVRAQASWWSEPGAAARSAPAASSANRLQPASAQAGSAKRPRALCTLAWMDCTTPISDSELTPASASAT